MIKPWGTPHKYNSICEKPSANFPDIVHDFKEGLQSCSCSKNFFLPGTPAAQLSH